MWAVTLGWIAALSFPWVLSVMILGIIGFYSAVAVRSGFTAFFLVAFMAAFISLSSYDLWGWMLANWVTMLIYAAIYIAIGVAWTFAKWTLNLLKARKAYMTLRNDSLPSYLDSKGVTELTPNLFADFQAYLAKRDSAVVRNASGMEVTSGFVADQTFLWPAYMFGFMVADALSALADLIVRVFGNSFRRIRNHIFRHMPELG